MDSDLWLRMRALLDRVLELEGSARSDYLDALRKENAELCADLERLLVEHRQLRDLPNAMELAAPAALREVREEAEYEQARVGQMVGPYCLLRLLGTGGMGAVYLAERTEEGFGHTVALKIVRKALGAEIARDRFERERKILAGLKHPGIAMLFDGGQTSEGQSFYTMEFVEGEIITEYCERNALALADRVRLLLQVAATLAYAHQNLIVHRDIKPSNVLVGSVNGRVKLVDFGLAKLLDEYTMPTMTQTNLGPMTPLCAAPEQFTGGATTVATDIYQFGMLCFLVLAGRVPYRADPHDNLHWARAVTEEEPLTLARAFELAMCNTATMQKAAIARFKRQLTKDVDAIVRKSLAKAPGERYRSMDAMITDLEAFLAGQPVSAHPAGFLYFSRRFIQRRRYAVAAAATAFAVLAAVSVVALRQSRAAAEHAERAAREEEVRNTTRAMLTNLLRSGPASAVEQRPKSALEALDRGTERTLRALGENPLHRAIAVGVLAESYLDLDHPTRARKLIEQNLPTLAAQRDRLGVDGLKIDLLLARAATELGDTATGERTLQRAKEEIETLRLPQDSPYRLTAGVVRIRLARYKGQDMAARETAAQLLREADRPGLNETLEFADLLHVYALQEDDGPLSTTLAERAWKILAYHYGEDSPAALAVQRLVIWNDLWYELHRFDVDQLITTQEVVLREAFGEESLDYADLLGARCYRRRLAKQYIDAEVDCRHVVTILEQSPDSGSELLANAIDNEADMLTKLGKTVAALALYERELALRTSVFDPNQRNVIHARLTVSDARCRAGDPDLAIREFDAAMVDYVAHEGPSTAEEAVYAANFADCLVAAGRRESARSILQDHGQLDPPRAGMSESRRATVEAAWRLVTR